jgi:hypothetical protein
MSGETGGDATNPIADPLAPAALAKSAVSLAHGVPRKDVCSSHVPAAAGLAPLSRTPFKGKSNRRTSFLSTRSVAGYRILKFPEWDIA